MLNEKPLISEKVQNQIRVLWIKLSNYNFKSSHYNFVQYLIL